LLQRSIAANGLTPQITLHEAGVSTAEYGAVVMNAQGTSGQHNWGGVVTHPARRAPKASETLPRGTTEAKTVTLDGIVSDINLLSPADLDGGAKTGVRELCLMKIDAEGAEILALRSGLARAVPAVRFLLLEYRPPAPIVSGGNSRDGTSAAGHELLNLVAESGFRSFVMLSGTAGVAVAAAAAQAAAKASATDGLAGVHRRGMAWMGEHVQQLAVLDEVARRLMLSEELEHTEVLLVR
jgi:hypothetical protein